MRASLRPAGRKDPDRLGRNGVLLLAETRLPAPPRRASAPTARPRAGHSALSATVATPGHSKVVPLLNSSPARDGAGAQDCDQREPSFIATTPSGRLVRQARRRATPQRLVFLVLDDLFALLSVAKMITDAGADDFIFTCKPTSHKTLYDFIDGAEFRRHEEKVRRHTKETLCYRIRGGPQGRQGRDVNWDWLRDCRRQGQGSNIPWPLVTSLSPRTMLGSSPAAGCVGRSKTRASTYWKTTNSEHNFGHGQRFLAMTLAALNLLAFARHAIVELLEPPSRLLAKRRSSEPASLPTSSC